MRHALIRAHDRSADDGLEVRDAIRRLSAEQAELVRLVHWEGFTIAEAGSILGVPASTARTRYQRARGDLRAALSESVDHRAGKGTPTDEGTTSV